MLAFRGRRGGSRAANSTFSADLPPISGAPVPRLSDTDCHRTTEAGFAYMASGPLSVRHLLVSADFSLPALIDTV